MASIPTFTFMKPKSTKTNKNLVCKIAEELDYDKNLTVKTWKDVPVVDIRVHDRQTNGKLLATKKGVMLYAAGWQRLLDILGDLKACFACKGKTNFWLQSITDRDQPAHVFASIYCPDNSDKVFYSFSNFFQPDKEDDSILPTGKGICLTEEQFDTMMTYIPAVNEKLSQMES